MKSEEQIERETEEMKWQILPSGRRDKYSRAQAEADAQLVARDWHNIRGGDREAALFLATEILVDAGLTRSAHLLLMRYFDGVR